MSLTESVIEGTIQPDGTLVLDEKLNLPAGRVQIIVQALPLKLAKKRGIVEVMEEIHARQVERGYQPRSVNDMLAEEESQLEEDLEYEKRFEQLWGDFRSGSTAKE